ncbi:Hsp20/alpha crystallin family protein [Fuchsiella alkaliacetigena]|uniref:Hsp20/alpha crystallin family protein n=1 Tax=Fuchsiella alkaliacetigena TaxID=957042 RepID=UPI00200A8CC6|nr:Hsp20/alpha crystallin family protein [Fuchsiella alkaliacetigena]MCK8823768.1 Hsp20/alpha crystallin family protein [Fuchsiella alkaliacetigena]
MIVIYTQNSLNHGSFAIAQQRRGQQQGFASPSFQTGMTGFNYSPASNAWSYRLQPISTAQATNMGTAQQSRGQFTQTAYQQSIPMQQQQLQQPQFQQQQLQQPQFQQQTTGMISPSISISETQDDLIIACNMPNVDLDNLSLTATENSLSIAAQAFIGQQSSSLHRTVPLPTMIRAEAVDASYNNGILQIRMPKQETSARRQLQVNINE